MNLKIKKALIGICFILLITINFCDCGIAKEYKPKAKLEPAGEMLVPRWSHDAVVLNDGRVFILGGSFTAGSGTTKINTEIYDPVTKKSREIKNKMFYKNAFALSRSIGFFLDNGKVLIITKEGIQIFDPETETFAKVDIKLPQETCNFGAYFSAIELRDKRILIYSSLDDIYIYTPASNDMEIIKTKHFSRSECGMSELENGNILITGGQKNNKVISDIIEFDIKTETYKKIGNLVVPLATSEHFKLPDGSILILPGMVNNTNPESHVIQLYNPNTNETKVIGEAPFPRKYTLLNEKLIFTGRNKMEIFDTRTNKLSKTNINIKRTYGHTTTIMKDDSLLIIGGVESTSFFAPCIKRIDRVYIK